MMEHMKRAYKRAHPRENQYFDEVDGEYRLRSRDDLE